MVEKRDINEMRTYYCGNAEKGPAAILIRELTYGSKSLASASGCCLQSKTCKKLDVFEKLFSMTIITQEKITISILTNIIKLPK